MIQLYITITLYITLGNDNFIFGKWSIIEEVPNINNRSCLPTSSVMKDNTWYFHSNSTFTFDHGQVTEDPDCTDPGCCTDIINLTGTWELSGNRLIVTATHATDDPTKTFDWNFFDAEITKIDDNNFYLTQSDPETGELKKIYFQASE